MENNLSQFFFSGIATGAIYALIALGFCIIENSTKIVNFAQGDFLTLGGMFMFTLLHALHVPLILAVLLAIGATALVGVAMERFTIRPARSKETVILVFITIGASIFIRGAIKILWGKSPKSLPYFSGDNPVGILGARILPQSLWIVAVTILVFLILNYFYRNTRYGKAMRAVAYDRRAAALLGINVEKMVMLSFALAGGMGAIAGVLIIPITTMTFDMGVVLGLKGFAAAVLGGYGNVMGAVVGGLLLGVMESLGAGLVSSTFKDVIAFVILLLVLFIRPRGILGRGEGERV